MASFKDITDMISKKKVFEPPKGFWLKFDRELGERLDAIDSRKSNRSYGFAGWLDGISFAFFQPKPVLAAAMFILALNIVLFSFASRGPTLVSVALLSRDDLAEELVLTDQLSSGENIVDF